MSRHSDARTVSGVRAPHSDRHHNRERRRHPEVRFGAYRLLHRIGTGGMAEVWRAEWHSPQGTPMIVALKRILPNLCERREMVEMFLTEARFAMRLDHPKIVRTFDAGEVDGQPYLAMELIDGIDLSAAWRASSEPLPVGFSVYVVREICRALAYLHSRADENGQPLGLVHRDVSPSNIMLGRDGSVKLCDFGVAKAVATDHRRVTRVGVLKGKLGYMAPEQLAGGRYDHRADLFALGVVLHELLANRRLFKAAEEHMTVALNYACNVPSALDRILLRVLARHPDERFATAEELARVLRHSLEDTDFQRRSAIDVIHARIEAVLARRRARRALGLGAGGAGGGAVLAAAPVAGAGQRPLPAPPEPRTIVPTGDEPIALLPVASEASQRPTAQREAEAPLHVPYKHMLVGLILSFALLSSPPLRSPSLPSSPPGALAALCSSPRRP
jgi:serine/threonine protein kinase